MSKAIVREANDADDLRRAADLAGITMACKEAYADASREGCADNPTVIAAVTTLKEAHAALVLADADFTAAKSLFYTGARGFIARGVSAIEVTRALWRADRATRAATAAYARLRAVIMQAGEERRGATALQLEFNKRLHELSVDILQQTVSFAASVAGELDELIESLPECQPGRSATFYPRIFALGPQKSSWTHTNQFTLALGASSFFLYAVDWLLFKRNDEVLRVAIFDPLADSLCKVLTDMRNQMNEGKQTLSKKDTHDIIAGLHQRYAKAPALFGNDLQDRNCGVWLAAYSITENINNKAEIFGTVIVTEFLKCLPALDLPKRIDALYQALNS